MKFRLINHKTQRLSAKYLTDVYDLSCGEAVDFLRKGRAEPS